MAEQTCGIEGLNDQFLGYHSLGLFSCLALRHIVLCIQSVLLHGQDVRDWTMEALRASSGRNSGLGMGENSRQKQAVTVTFRALWGWERVQRGLVGPRQTTKDSSPV